jgi:hypothetical protein
MDNGTNDERYWTPVSGRKNHFSNNFSTDRPNERKKRTQLQKNGTDFLSGGEQ